MTRGSTCKTVLVTGSTQAWAPSSDEPTAYNREINSSATKTAGRNGPSFRRMLDNPQRDISGGFWRNMRNSNNVNWRGGADLEVL